MSIYTGQQRCRIDDIPINKPANVKLAIVTSPSNSRLTIVAHEERLKVHVLGRMKDHRQQQQQPHRSTWLVHIDRRAYVNLTCALQWLVKDLHLYTSRPNAYQFYGAQQSIRFLHYTKSTLNSRRAFGWWTCRRNKNCSDRSFIEFVPTIELITAKMKPGRHLHIHLSVKKRSLNLRKTDEVDYCIV